MNCFDTVIIGSGPAGLAAACAAGKIGKRCVILEKQPRPAMKLLASGGGRCNVSNILDLEEFAGKFGRQWRFLLPALSAFHGEKLLAFFRDRQLPLELTDGFHYFPVTGRAMDILEIFQRDISKYGGRIICNEKVVKLIPGRIWEIRSAAGNVYRAAQVICACGGRGYPALGGSMAGYELAAGTGHKITELFPAMTGVICADPRIGQCAGISIGDCIATIDLKGRERCSARGELLFTHRGFSAFAILDLAGKAAQLLTRYERIPLKIDFLPQTTVAEITAQIAVWRKHSGKKRVSSLLAGYLPRRIAELLLNGNDPEISRLSAETARNLTASLKGAVFELCGVESWDKAMVTAGGVSLKEINPDSLESKLFPGLFFAGEMLDVTGPCGGFNITWALASGMLAGGRPVS
ncbi:MAG: aminoacetone oxidase family FAD-binding enzyme [Lentisphaeria bacterium]|nr:aminoacetone oxidase family FAD-binding enzyme [Lentisphaeria bacterium]